MEGKLDPAPSQTCVLLTGISASSSFSSEATEVCATNPAFLTGIAPICPTLGSPCSMTPMIDPGVLSEVITVQNPRNAIAGDSSVPFLVQVHKLFQLYGGLELRVPQPLSACCSFSSCLTS